MSKAWTGGVGAWALDAERDEAEERERAAAATPLPPPPSTDQGPPSELFPSLKEAAASKPKKKRQTSMSLSEFMTTGGSTQFGPGGGGRSSSINLIEPRGLTPDELLRLPTGPRDRSEEELQYGRGFRSYGLSSGGPRGEPRRQYGGGFDDEGSSRRGPVPSRDFDQPSRADEVDNWAAVKKTVAHSSDSGRPERYGSIGVGGPSRADEVDNWAATKKPMPSRTFGSGFRDSPSPADSDRWVRGVGFSPSVPHNGERERPRLVLDPPKKNAEVAAGGTLSDSVRNRPSPFGAARPREEVLADKGLDWRKLDTEIDPKKTSRPTSSQSSRPSSQQSSRLGSPRSQTGVAELAIKPRPKVNPFGDAKPREVILEGKGKDWRKMDLELEHRRVDRPETEEEKRLKEEINYIKKVLSEHSKGTLTEEELNSMREGMVQMERELEVLIRELDDKLRFGQKASGDIRPGSGAGRPSSASGGRSGMLLDRPPSQSGRSEDTRVMDFVERPRSHGGMGESWSRPVEEGRGFQRVRDRGFFDNRNVDRSRSGERW